MVIDFKQPITMSDIKADPEYPRFLVSFVKSDAIFKVVKYNLWDQYFAQDWKRLGKQIRESPQDSEKLYHEGDDLDDKCELLAYAICRKNNLVGPRYEFQLWNMLTADEKYGLHIILSRKMPNCGRLNEEDTERMYNDAMQMIHSNESH